MSSDIWNPFGESADPYEEIRKLAGRGREDNGLGRQTAPTGDGYGGLFDDIVGAPAGTHTSSVAEPGKQPAESVAGKEAAPADTGRLWPTGPSLKDVKTGLGGLYDKASEAIGAPKRGIDEIVRDITLGGAATPAASRDYFGFTPGNEAGQAAASSFMEPEALAGSVINRVAGRDLVPGIPEARARERAAIDAASADHPTIARAVSVADEGLRGLGEKAGSFVTDPAMGLIPGHKLVGAAFLPGIAEGMGQNFGAAMAAYDNGDYEKAARLGGSGFVDAVMTGLIGHHLASGAGAAAAGASDAARQPIQGEIVGQGQGLTPARKALTEAPVDAELVRGPRALPAPALPPADGIRGVFDDILSGQEQPAGREGLQRWLQEAKEPRALLPEGRPEPAVAAREATAPESAPVAVPETETPPAVAQEPAGPTPEERYAMEKDQAGKLLDQGTALDQKSLVDGLGVSPSRAARLLKRLRSEGMIDEAGKTPTGLPAEEPLTAAAEPATMEAPNERTAEPAPEELRRAPVPGEDRAAFPRGPEVASPERGLREALPGQRPGDEAPRALSEREARASVPEDLVVYKGLQKGGSLDPEDAGAGHLWGSHFTPDEGTARLFADKRGTEGEVAAARLKIKQPFLADDHYTYADLRKIDPEAALSAAREAGAADADSPVPAAAFRHALREKLLGGIENPTPQEVVAALRESTKRLQDAGFDGYKYETRGADGRKVDAYAAWDKNQIEPIKAEEAPRAEESPASHGAEPLAAAGEASPGELPERLGGPGLPAEPIQAKPKRGKLAPIRTEAAPVRSVPTEGFREAGQSLERELAGRAKRPGKFPTDELGQDVYPGEEHLTPEQRRDLTQTAIARAEDLGQAQNSEPTGPRPLTDMETGRPLQKRYGGELDYGGDVNLKDKASASNRSNKRGGPLEGIEEGPKEIVKAIKKDKGNALERRVREAILKNDDEFGQYLEKGPEGGDASFEPSRFERKEELPAGASIIRNPAGTFSFVGRVPEELSYVQKDGSPATPEQIKNARQFGPAVSGVRTRTWATREEAVAAAKEIARPEPTGRPTGYERTKEGEQGLLMPPNKTTVPTRTEGREGSGPLFTQESDARARAEKESQGGLFADADAAKERLIAHGENRAEAGYATADALIDLVTLGARHWAGGLRSFGRWAGAMVKDVGAWAGKYLRTVWPKAREAAAKEGHAASPKAEVPFVVTRQAEARLRDLGFSDRQIGRMSPGQAKSVLDSGAPAGSREAVRALGQGTTFSGAGNEGNLPNRNERVSARREPPPKGTQGPPEASRLDAAAQAYKKGGGPTSGKPGGQPDLPLNLDRLGVSDDTKARISSGWAALKPEFKSAKGKVTFKEMEGAGLRLGGILSDRDLEQAIRNGAPLDHASVVLGGKIQAEKQGAVEAALSKLDAAPEQGEARDAAERDYLSKVLDAANFELAMKGAKADAARTLAAMRIESTARTPMDRVIGELFKQKHGMLTDKQVAAIMDVGKRDPSKLPDVVRAAMDPRFRQKFMEYYRASMLSPPPSWIAKASGDIVSQALDLAGHALSVPVDQVVSRLSGKVPERTVGELFSHVAGIADGIPTGLAEGLRQLRTEQFDPSRPDLHSVGAISGLKGKVIRTPFRIFSAITRAAEITAARGELYRQAFQRASAEARARGIPKGEVSDYIGNRTSEIRDSVLADRTGKVFPEIQRAMAEKADYLTFQQKLGSIAQIVNRARTANTPASLPLELLAPFYKVPLNLTKRALEHTPLNFVRLANEIRKGNLTHGDAAEEMAKPLLGSMAATAFYLAAKQGLLTGNGPADSRKRDALLASGWKPYALKIPDGKGGSQYVGYHRLEPISPVLGMAADLAEAPSEDTRTDLVKKITGSVSKNLTNRTFFKSLSDAVDFVHDPFRFGKNLIGGMAGGLVPASGLLRRTAQAIDPVVHETQLSDASVIKANIPFLSESVPAKHTITGEEARRGGDDQSTAARIYNAVSPFDVSGQGADTKLEQTLGETGGTSPVKPTITVRGQRIELSPDEEELLLKARRQASEVGRSYVENPNFMKLPDTQAEAEATGRTMSKESAFRALFEKYDAAGRGRLRSIPSFAEKLRQAQQKGRVARVAQEAAP